MFRIEGWLVGVALVCTSACGRPVNPLPEAPPVAPTPAPPIVFPRDAGPHDDLTEWWYYTGHFTSDDGHSYGFEFVVFQVQRQSVPTGYLAHFAVSDIDGQHFSHQMRVASGQARSAFPLEVDGWTLSSDGSTDHIQAAMSEAEGAQPAYTLRLDLVDDKAPALHNGGYIDYGAAGGSYYYSRTRLRVAGQLDAASVHGIAWMDHQWGNFVVTAAGGWDWYSLQLDDNTELMLYVLRDVENTPTGVYGTRVLADGTTDDMSADSVQSTALGTWTSPHTGAVYPSGWALVFASGQRLVLEPQLLDQELWFPNLDRASRLAYWEGAVSVTGDRTGVGYVELTGYAR
jgi:predicted secreted hydrolase